MLLSERNIKRREILFQPDTSGRTIYSSPGGLKSLAEQQPCSPLTGRYLYRAFDRQWIINDKRVASRFRQELWDLHFDDQVFLISRPTHQMKSGSGAFVSTYVPDMDCFRGSYGGKDVFPLYRDQQGGSSIDPELHAFLKRTLGGVGEKIDEVTPKSLFAYCFAVLAGTDYTTRFRAELETPGPRIPLTRDPKLFKQMAAFGGQLLWLQTFGERFRTAERKALKCDESIRWSRKPTRIPDDSRDFGHDAEMDVLTIADGKLTGVSKSVWDFEVSGMQVIKKWLGYRTAKGAGRAASSDNPLDKIRPTEWEPEWSDELREIVHVLTETEKLRPKGVKLLEQILEGELIKADELPQPPEELRKPPARVTGEGLFDDDESETE
jgi:predicted helicase